MDLFPFQVKKVIGGTPGNTEYDEENVLRYRLYTDALDAATQLHQTSDIFDGDEKVARVHVDGGIDHLRQRR
jgi:hypothetical protein